MHPPETQIAKMLDAVVKTGKPKTVRWKGMALRVTPPSAQKTPAKRKKNERALTPEQLKRKRWLEDMKPNPGLILCDPEELVHIDWSVYWNPDPN